MKKIWFTLIVLSLTACNGLPVSASDINSAQFGAKPTNDDAIRKIRNYLDNVLIDPDSLKLKCSEVIGKAWARQNQFDSPDYGYLVVCNVNSKNRMGGYVGAKSNYFLINDSKIKLFDYSDFVVDPRDAHYHVIQ